MIAIGREPQGRDPGPRRTRARRTPGSRCKPSPACPRRPRTAPKRLAAPPLAGRSRSPGGAQSAISRTACPRRHRERRGRKPDRIAMWAVLLGLALAAVAATSSHAAVLSHAAGLIAADAGRSRPRRRPRRPAAPDARSCGDGPSPLTGLRMGRDRAFIRARINDRCGRRPGRRRGWSAPLEKGAPRPWQSREKSLHL